jgi:hypothetical protein
MAAREMIFHRLILPQAACAVGRSVALRGSTFKMRRIVIRVVAAWGLHQRRAALAMQGGQRQFGLHQRCDVRKIVEILRLDR